jgi:hypothetical protein
MKKMTMSLRELQEQFQAYVLEQDPALFKLIDSNLADSVERVDVYRKGYSLRLLESLENDYCVLRGHVGPEIFEDLGRKYINNYPSNNFSICIFGRHFSQFLAGEGHKLWSEMADFEWALGYVLDAADAPVLTLAELGTVAGEDWPNLQFTLHPSVHFYKYSSNAPQITYALMVEQEAPESHIDENTSDWVIWRFELKPFFESISEAKFWMLGAIEQGKTFAEICEGLCQWFSEEEVAQYAASVLGSWINMGMIATFRVA